MTEPVAPKSQETIDTERVVEKVRKLFQLAAKNTNEAESASATAKAMELLAAYNLDMATVQQGGNVDGRREDARVRGGMYVYERELWEHVATLNFCWYFSTREFKRDEKAWAKGIRRTRVTFQHRLVGKVVNTTGTKIMAEYLQGAIERLCRERYPANNQFFMSEAVAFREGMADKINQRLSDRRRKFVAAEELKARKAAEEAVRAGISTATAVTVATVHKAENQANYDFVHGEGAWAKREAATIEWRKERAEALARAEAEYAAWAAANPKEAAKEAAKERAAERRRWASPGRREAGPSARDLRRRGGSYHEGWDKGSKVSLDQQVDKKDDQRRLK